MISPEFSVSSSHLLVHRNKVVNPILLSCIERFLLLMRLTYPFHHGNAKLGRFLQWRGRHRSADSNLDPLPRLDQPGIGEFLLSLRSGILDHPARLATCNCLIRGGADCSRPLVMGTSLLLMRRRFLWLCTYFWALFWWPKLSTMCPRPFRPKFWKFSPYERIWRPWFYMFLASFFKTFFATSQVHAYCVHCPGIVGLGQCWDRCKPTPSERFLSGREVRKGCGRCHRLISATMIFLFFVLLWVPGGFSHMLYFQPLKWDEDFEGQYFQWVWNYQPGAVLSLLRRLHVFVWIYPDWGVCSGALRWNWRQWEDAGGCGVHGNNKLFNGRIRRLYTRYQSRKLVGGFSVCLFIFQHVIFGLIRVIICLPHVVHIGMVLEPIEEGSSLAWWWWWVWRLSSTWSRLWPSPLATVSATTPASCACPGPVSCGLIEMEVASLTGRNFKSTCLLRQGRVTMPQLNHLDRLFECMDRDQTGRLSYEEISAGLLDSDLKWTSLKLQWPKIRPMDRPKFVGHGDQLVAWIEAENRLFESGAV